MSIVSTAALVDALRQFRLLDPKQVEELPSLQARFPEAKDLARELMQRNWLTAYQANNLLLGKGQSLVLGSYVLLERLGAGGMGEVFKARHRKLGRISALKVIHKKRLDNPDAVRRFQREVRAAAALNHPNIVLAYDADQIGDTHLFVMEYIEGAQDLSHLVKANGPLPVNHACEYVRQAALGLQHAFERGMVHRDIKPANILLTSGGHVVKILDMGLARLDSGSADDKSSSMTQEGTVMGTPDYMAPEQAEDSHTVDIRAEIYSLGCTLYVLLTGQVPHPGGSMIEKLLKHRLDEPRPLRQMRPDVPPGVEAIVRKLMAKRPEDRYQTPQEVATALGAVDVTAVASRPAQDSEQTIAVAPDAAPRGVRKAYDSALKYMAKRDDTEVLVSPFARRRKAWDRQLRMMAVAAGIVAIVATAILVRVVLREPAVNNNAQGDNKPPVVSQNPPTKKDDEATQEQKRFASLLGGKWYYIGPFDNPPGFKGFDAVYPPEKGIDLKAAYPGKNNEQVQWKEYSGFKVGVHVDFLPLFDKPEQKEWACIYLCHEINVAEATSLPISLGSDDTLTVWLNDEQVVSDSAGRNGRSCVPDSNFTTLNLKAGKNKLLVKICQSGAEWGFYIAPKRKLFYEQSDFEVWRKQVAASSAEKQVKEVAAKLKELNPGFDGKVEHKIEGGVVTELSFGVTGVLDISPVRALVDLKKLSCCGILYRPNVAFSDLWPLKDMSLTSLECWCTSVSDLSPLKDMKLISLWCGNTLVSDLIPLKDMQLKHLDCGGTKVFDLSSLKDMKLNMLWYWGSSVSDLKPLMGMPIGSLCCDFVPARDTEILRSFKALEQINQKPAKEFWDEVDQMKLNKKP